MSPSQLRFMIVASSVLAACSSKAPPAAPPPGPPAATAASAPAPHAVAASAPTPDVVAAPSPDAVAAAVDLAPGAPVEVGALRTAEVAFDYGVIVPDGAEAARAKAAVEASLRAADIPLVALDAEPARGLCAAVKVVTAIEVGLEPEVLRLFGRGVEADRGRIEKATSVVAIFVKGPAAEVTAVVRTSSEAARRGAEAVGGWVMDLTTSEVFGAPELALRRAPGHERDVERLVDVHLVREEAGVKVFIQTVGLDRLGVPDVVIRDLDMPLAERARTVLLGAAQLLFERGSVSRRGAIDVDLAALAEPAWKERLAALRAAGGSGRATLRATGSANTIPDAPPIIALAFEGEDVARILDEVAGTPVSEVTGAPTDDPELAAARARAVAELAALGPRFARGVPEGERLRVKARFAEGDVVEWMWVEVSAWSGSNFTGVLVDEPTALERIHNGAHVTVPQVDVFDYLHVRRDGTSAGDETSRILRARGR